MTAMKQLSISFGMRNTAGTLQVIMATPTGELTPASADYLGDDAAEVTRFIVGTGSKAGDIVYVPNSGKTRVCAVIVSSFEQTEADMQALGESITKHANTRDMSRVAIAFDSLGLDNDVALGKFVYGLQIASCAYTLKSNATAETLEEVNLYSTDLLANTATSWQVVLDALATAMGSIFMRQLIQMPPNKLGTRQLLQAAESLDNIHPNLRVSVTKVTAGSKMGAMYAVGQVSSQDSLLIEIRYDRDPDAPLTALVGKGLVYDTGGINLKPNGGKGMKGDMGGSAMVLGTLFAAALRDKEVNLIGVIGAVCNDIGPDAYRPDDVLTAYNGTTIEVGNTDAEGRLVLADCLSYTEEKYKPARMFSFATLTGAAVVATGRRAPIFSDDNTFAADVVESANAAGEMVTHVLMDDYLKPLLNSPIADTSNISTGRMCGHTTAAIFLNKFVASTPYLHVDIAGASDLAGPGGGAFGIPMMVRYLLTYATK